MSYPKDLDEYTEDQLREELARRQSLRDENLCDYCGQPGNSPLCRMRDRHMLASFILFQSMKKSQ